jgi:hypothetical protein
MSLLKNEIISTLQQQPTLLRDFPWYPTAYLAQAAQDNNLQKLAAFVNHPLRVHMLVSAEELIIETASPTIKAEETPNAPLDTVAINEKTADEPEEKPFVLPTISTPAESTNESFLFQPFHTVDYFASQGIKVDQSQLSTTRFDTQLKSFSQWLKTMKRADYETGQFKADPAVEAQAKASLEAKEVLTEAMADVLAQQGRHAQAIDVYRKLTLLHPEKSAFFAAQIEKLKA